MKNNAEFHAWAKDRRVSAATCGIGSFAHVVRATLNRNHGFNVEAVHYRGEGSMWGPVVLEAIKSPNIEPQ